MIGMRETIRTNDAELYVGWPTTDDDAERDRSVQVGARFGDSVAWVTLTSPDQVADFRRTLQRASRTVWPREVEEITGNTFVDAPVPSDDVIKQMSATYDHLSPFGPVATGLVTPETDPDAQAADEAARFRAELLRPRRLGPDGRPV